MQPYMYDFCLKQLSSASAPDRDSGSLSDAARLCILVRLALYIEHQRSLRQRLPRLGQLAFPSKLLRRFLRGCVVFTAHGLVTAPASVCVRAREKTIWMNRIFARVMSGFVMREEVRLQAAAAARIAGELGVIDASRSGDVADVLSYLIADANCVNERDGDQRTALHWAASRGHTAVCELLIAGKADVNAKDYLQSTALHDAASRGFPAVCELLIAGKADVNANNDLQSTALHRAAYNGHPAVCELLIAGKADVNAKDYHGYTPLNYAIFQNSSDVEALLRSVGASQ